MHFQQHALLIACISLYTPPGPPHPCNSLSSVQVSVRGSEWSKQVRATEDGSHHLLLPTPSSSALPRSSPTPAFLCGDALGNALSSAPANQQALTVDIARGGDLCSHVISFRYGDPSAGYRYADATAR